MLRPFELVQNNIIKFYRKDKKKKVNVNITAKFLITSEMRVGSRWIHYLLQDITDYRVTPEIDVRLIAGTEKTVRSYFNQKRIPKYHHTTQFQILRHVKPHDYKIIGIVRNPFDRITSLTFHQRYKPPGKGLEKIKLASSDIEAVRTAFYHEDYRIDNERQFILMVPGASTKQFKSGKTEKRGELEQNYIWTTYEWLKEDTFGEIKVILDFLGFDLKDTFIKTKIRKHSFRNKSGREPGQEKRNDEWRRKGVNDDWKNFFTEDMYKDGIVEQATYLMIKENEEKM